MQDIFQLVLKEQKKIIKAGFKWPSTTQAINKVQEELLELVDAISLKNETAIKEEFGDLILAVMTLSLYLKIDLSSSLNDAFKKFNKRYKQMHKVSKEKGILFSTLSLKEKEALWLSVK